MDLRRGERRSGQAQGGRRVQGRSQELLSGGDLVHGAQQDARRRRRLRGQGREGRGGDRPRLLRRRATSGHQGRRHHYGAKRTAHHQRADRGGDRVRYGQALREGAQSAHLRLRRRHSRRDALVGRGRYLRGQGHRGRQPSRRRGHRQHLGGPFRQRVQAQDQKGHHRQP